MGKVLGCYWKVFINGNALDDLRRKCIDEISIQELCDGSDACSLKVSDPHFLYLEDNIFIEEATISIEMGWHGDSHLIKFNGYISAVDINFPENGCPVLSVFCLDNTHLMNRKKQKRSWDNVTRPEVVQKIAKEYGFKCVVETGYTFTKEDTISQSDTTDIEFCENLAREERVPFMCKLIDNTIYYVKMGLLKDPTATLYYRQFPYDVISFSPRITKETIKEEVTASDISTTNKKEDSSVANREETPREVQGEPVNAKVTIEKVYDPTTGQWGEIRQEVK